MSLLDTIIGFVAPPECSGCGVEDHALCSDCLIHCIKPFVSSCFWCNSLTQNAKFCRNCRSRSKLVSAYAVSEYSEVVKQLLYDYKYHHLRRAAPDIARLLVEGSTAFRDLLPKKYFVIPVPSTTYRVRERSFDHGFMMAREFARQTQGMLMPALRRIGSAHQVGATRALRTSQLHGAMYVAGKYENRLKAATCLLIDDVVTTGASLEEAARALKDAGAAYVFAIVVARKNLGG